MRLSTKSRFAVTAMLDVALRDDRGPVSLAAISVRHQISLSYLEQLFSKLRQPGLVESTRGPGGGYSRSRNAEKITMADIVGAVDAPSDEEAAAEGGWTVSYTHLDVYKRQSWPWSAPTAKSSTTSTGKPTSPCPCSKTCSASPPPTPA